MKTTHISKKLFIFFLTAMLIMSAGKAYSFNSKDIDLKLRVSISEIYDDNITFVRENEKEDFVTNLSFGLGVKYEGKTRALELTANVFQQFFADYDNFNNTSEDLTLNFQQEFSKYDRISLRNIFTHTYEPRSFEEAFGITKGRYSYYRNRFNLTYAKDISKQLGISARYANEIDEVSREDLSDSSLNRVGLEATYFLASTTILMFSYDFSRRDFDPGNNATIHTIAPGLKHYFTKQLYFDGKAGIDFINSYNDKNYAKPLIQASVTNDIDENSRASISFTKRYYTNAYTQNLFDYWQTSGIFTRRLFKRLRCSLSGFYGEGEYITTNITDKLRGVSIGFTYDLSKKIKGNLRYTYSDVDSTIDTREYTKNRIFLGLTMEF